MISASILKDKPLLLEDNNRFPDDIIFKINNIICDEYIKEKYINLEHNFIKNIIGMFLNDKKLSKFIYYLGYQTYYFNYIYPDDYNLSSGFGVYGEKLSNFTWGDFETDTSYEDYKDINIDSKEQYILNIPKDEIFAIDSINIANSEEHNFYRFDVNIYSNKLTLNENIWILKYFSYNDINILENNNDICIDIDEDKYDNIYDYDNEEFANIWNLFNRGFIKLNIFKIIYIFCYNTDINNKIQKYYNFIGGKGKHNIEIDYSELFHKTCFNFVKYFNKKIKKASDDRMVISYLYAIYSNDDGNGNIYFNEDHELYENKAYDLLFDNDLLQIKNKDNITEILSDILDLLYELYL
jgi:hypothetical protein